MAVGKLVLFSLFLLVEVLLVHAVGEESDSGVNVKPPEIKVHKEDRPGWAIPREADVPVPSPAESSRETRKAEAPGIRRLGKHDSSSDDGSMAAGGVIIGGLVTVFSQQFLLTFESQEKKMMFKFNIDPFVCFLC
ncbi:hypothetical protein CXB51_006658 [Gossypium anomalum]|uniref:Uncharacterized protein n=1 Tax=Gossypium anomalum TaxID=47600 RepID=A0A8J5ZV74_9ROSI|nr:hypothetical protein CXB51_006658 [Gossypium anomalum]